MNRLLLVVLVSIFILEFGNDFVISVNISGVKGKVNVQDPILNLLSLQSDRELSSQLQISILDSLKTIGGYNIVIGNISNEDIINTIINGLDGISDERWDGFIIGSDFIRDYMYQLYQIMDKANGHIMMFIDIGMMDKIKICEIYNGCLMQGVDTRILSIFPNGIKENGDYYYGMFTWLDEITFDNRLVEPIVNSLDLKIKKGSSNPINSLIPPLNSNIPFDFVQSISVSQMVNNITEVINGSQIVTITIENNYYIYKDFIRNQILLLLDQNIIADQGKMLIMDPMTMMGFFQSSFSFINTPVMDHLNIEPLHNIKSPNNIDQIVGIYKTYTTNINNYEIQYINPNNNEEILTWKINYQSNPIPIGDWGIIDITKTKIPQNSRYYPVSFDSKSTGWVFHQQFPVDIFALGTDNFPNWYRFAYDSDGSILYQPALSRSSLSISSISAWTIDTQSQRVPDSIIVDSSFIQMSNSIIKPNEKFNHHKLEVRPFIYQVNTHIKINCK